MAKTMNVKARIQLVSETDEIVRSYVIDFFYKKAISSHLVEIVRDDRGNPILFIDGFKMPQSAFSSVAKILYKIEADGNLDKIVSVKKLHNGVVRAWTQQERPFPRAYADVKFPCEKEAHASEVTRKDSISFVKGVLNQPQKPLPKVKTSDPFAAGWYKPMVFENGLITQQVGRPTGADMFDYKASVLKDHEAVKKAEAEAVRANKPISTYQIESAELTQAYVGKEHFMAPVAEHAHAAFPNHPYLLGVKGASGTYVWTDKPQQTEDAALANKLARTLLRPGAPLFHSLANIVFVSAKELGIKYKVSMDGPFALVVDDEQIFEAVGHTCTPAQGTALLNHGMLNAKGMINKPTDHKQKRLVAAAREINPEASLCFIVEAFTQCAKGAALPKHGDQLTLKPEELLIMNVWINPRQTLLNFGVDLRFMDTLAHPELKAAYHVSSLAEVQAMAKLWDEGKFLTLAKEHEAGSQFGTQGLALRMQAAGLPLAKSILEDVTSEFTNAFKKRMLTHRLPGYNLPILPHTGIKDDEVIVPAELKGKYPLGSVMIFHRAPALFDFSWVALKVIDHGEQTAFLMTPYTQGQIQGDFDGDCEGGILPEFLTLNDTRISNHGSLTTKTEHSNSGDSTWKNVMAMVVKEGDAKVGVAVNLGKALMFLYHSAGLIAAFTKGDDSGAEGAVPSIRFKFARYIQAVLNSMKKTVDSSLSLHAFRLEATKLWKALGGVGEMPYKDISPILSAISHLKEVWKDHGLVDRVNELRDQGFTATKARALAVAEATTYEKLSPHLAEIRSLGYGHVADYVWSTLTNLTEHPVLDVDTLTSNLSRWEIMGQALPTDEYEDVRVAYKAIEVDYRILLDQVSQGANYGALMVAIEHKLQAYTLGFSEDQLLYFTALTADKVKQGEGSIKHLGFFYFVALTLGVEKQVVAEYNRVVDLGID